jgi:hypothetical protein
VLYAHACTVHPTTGEKPDGSKPGASNRRAGPSARSTMPSASAPELNPDEGFRHQLKGVELRNLCCFDLHHLRDELRTAVNCLRRKPRILKGCFAGAGL